MQNTMTWKSDAAQETTWLEPRVYGYQNEGCTISQVQNEHLAQQSSAIRDLPTATALGTVQDTFSSLSEALQ